METTISDAVALSPLVHDEAWRSINCESTCSLTSPDAPLRIALSRPSSVLHLFRVRLTSSLAVSLTCMSSPMAAPTSDTIFWCPGRPCSKESLSVGLTGRCNRQPLPAAITLTDKDDRFAQAQRTPKTWVARRGCTRLDGCIDGPNGAGLRDLPSFLTGSSC